MRSFEFVSALPLVVGLGIRGGGNQCYSSKVSCVTCLWPIFVWLKLLTGLFIWSFVNTGSASELQIVMGVGIRGGGGELYGSQ